MSISFTSFRRVGPDFAVLILLLIIVACFGGSSRADSWSQLAVRSGAFGALLYCLARRAAIGRDMRWFLGLLLAACVLVAIQLVPLPPSIWQALPGRGLYATSATVAGLEQPWRPWTVTPESTLSALFSLSVPAAAMLLVARLSMTRRIELLPAVILVMAASALVGFVQFASGSASTLRWYGYLESPEAVGLFANRNHHALFLACGFPVLGAWAVSGPSRSGAKRALIATGLAVMFLVMIQITGSRSGIILAAIGLILTMFIARHSLLREGRALWKARRRSLFAGLALAAGTATLLIFWLVRRGISLERLRQLDITGDTRLKSWPITLDLIRDFAPFGTGFGSFDRLYRQVEPFDQLSQLYLNHAHNDFLEIVLEGGIFAVALLAVFLTMITVAVLRMWRRPRTDRTPAAEAGVAIVLLCLLASVSDYPMRTALMMTLCVIACGWIAAGPARSAPASPRR